MKNISTIFKCVWEEFYAPYRCVFDTTVTCLDELYAPYRWVLYPISDELCTLFGVWYPICAPYRRVLSSIPHEMSFVLHMDESYTP